MHIIPSILLMLLVGCTQEVAKVEKAPIPIHKDGSAPICLEWKTETRLIGKATPYSIQVCKKWKE